jgi:maleate isomerase
MVKPDPAAVPPGIRQYAGLRFGWRARFGMILPSANRVAEPELMDMLPPGVSLHTTRIKLAGTSPAELLASTEKVEEAASLLADNGPDLIAFHCTAVSTYDADLEESLKRRITQSSGRPATATSDALLAAFRVLNVRKLVMLSPYPQALNDREVAFLQRHGLQVVHEIGLDLPVQEHADVPPEEWHRQALAHRHPDADAYFLGCTNIRAVPAIGGIERDLGRPVVTSNQAILWHALRMNGMPDRMEGFGALLARH